MKKYLWICLLLGYANMYAQIANYQYARPLTPVTETWHKLALPNEIFSQTQSIGADLRIVNITELGDTLMIPYLGKWLRGEQTKKKVAIKMINKIQRDGNYYFTLEVPTQEVVNQLSLNFTQSNFDWQVNLSGSQDQKEWDLIIADYRILSIENGLTNYKFTTLQFPDAKYRYFKVGISNKQKPKLRSATLALQENSPPTYQTYPISKMDIAQERQKKKTIIHLQLKQKLPVSSVDILTKDALDYVRPTAIYAIVDSVQTKKGWHYYEELVSPAVLSSIDQKPIVFDQITAKKWKIVINNEDNQPLTIDHIVVKGYIQELTARFPKPENSSSYLIYGQSKANKPSYDLAAFQHKIPKTITPLQVGEEQLWSGKEASNNKTKPFFLSKVWLWLIMGAVIILLGRFSLKMIQEKSKE